jgi:ribonucleoside-diphosphate reductase alpha chain
MAATPTALLTSEAVQMVQRAAHGLPEEFARQVLQDMMPGSGGAPAEELEEAAIQAALQNQRDDPDYGRIAAGVLLQRIYRHATGTRTPSEHEYRAAFCRYICSGVDRGVLDPRLLHFDLETLAAALVPERDRLLDYLGLATLADRYLVRDLDEDRLLETPQMLWMRVAMGVSLLEPDPTAAAVRFYHMMSTLRYLPSTPTLFNSGTPHCQLSSCYLSDVQDSLDHILESAWEFGRLAKYAGGIGASITKLRALGSPVRGVNGRSSGLVPFANLYDALIKAIDQGGRRRGTLALYLEPWHLEIEAFLDLKQNSGDHYRRTPSLNTVLWIPDEFMYRVEAGADWYLFDPAYTPDLPELYGRAFSRRYSEYILQAESGQLPASAWRKMSARELLRRILVSLQETSHPWLTFKDAGNVRSQLKNCGVIHSSNLCTEIFLPTDPQNIAVCNLASIVLPRHLRGRRIDWDLLAESVHMAIRHLDNVIDVNFYPVEKARCSNLANRPVGLGLMGFTELCQQLGYPYDSPEAAELADQVVEFISFHAIRASAQLARERGPYPTFQGSAWSQGRVPIDSIAELEAERGRPVQVDRTARLDWDSVRNEVRGGMRNSTVMAIAPTSSIGLIAGTTPSLDPHFANVYARSTLSGKFLTFNPQLVEDLKALGLWEAVRDELIAARGDIQGIAAIPDELKRLYRTAFQIRPEAYLEVAARAQKWVDMGISRNLYLTTRNLDETAAVYLDAWRRGLKSTYYLFVQPQMHAEQSTVVVNKARRRPTWAVRLEAELLQAGAAGQACPTDPTLRAQCESCQ